MTLNGKMAFILRYFTELGSFRGALCKIGWQSHNYGQFTITMSLTLCGPTGQKPTRKAQGSADQSMKKPILVSLILLNKPLSIDAGGFHHPLVQLIPPINYSIKQEIFTTVPVSYTHLRAHETDS